VTTSNKDAKTGKAAKADTGANARETEKPAATFAEDGGALARDVREYAEDLRGQLTDLNDRAAKVLAEGEPQDGDEQVAAGCRRISTAVNALSEQVDALVHAAAQLERDAVR
jgi:hypothetical protein